MPTDVLSIWKFRALSDQLYKSAEYHKHVRKEIVKQVSIILFCLYIILSFYYHYGLLCHFYNFE